MNKGASPNARHSFVIVTDEHKTEGDDCQNVFRWAQKEKNEKKKYFRSSTALLHTDLVAKFVPKIRGYVNYTLPR